MRNLWAGMGFRHELELTENRYNDLSSQVKQECSECKKNWCFLENCETFREKVETLTYSN